MSGELPRQIAPVEFLFDNPAVSACRNSFCSESVSPYNVNNLSRRLVEECSYPGERDPGLMRAGMESSPRRKVRMTRMDHDHEVGFGGLPAFRGRRLCVSTGTAEIFVFRPFRLRPTVSVRAKAHVLLKGR